MKALAIGGTADHVHILISLPATLSVAKALQLLKGILSKWHHRTRSFREEFIAMLHRHGFD
jgi:REP-associated tyrosine transposase